MPLIVGRNHVLDVYREAAECKWVLPTFNSENLTTTEAILAAARDYGETIGRPDLPVCVGITNLYPQRSQSVNYTHTRRWEVGLSLFLEDLRILTGFGSPFAKLRVLVHLDHAQWDADAPLFESGLSRFSSVMYDASVLPLSENIARTAEFFEHHGREIVVEGACAEIREAAGVGDNDLTTPEEAERYWRDTGVDILVADLGTEHRASSSVRTYHAELAREFSARVGPRLCLHGTSSVPPGQVRGLFHDGVRKVNIWTALERDSSPALFVDMLKNASRIVGPEAADTLLKRGFLGPNSDTTGAPSIDFYTTYYRQDWVFRQMTGIVRKFLSLWYV